MKLIFKITLSLSLVFAFGINAYTQNTPCAPADIVFPSGDCGVTASQVSINLDNQSNSGIGDPGGCPGGVWNNGYSDGWFQIVVPPGVQAIDLQMAWSGCSGFLCVDNPGYAFYEALNGDCNNIVPFGCGGDNGALAGSNAEVLLTGLDPGDLILIRVWETDDQGSDVSINAQISPPNDLCEDAIPLQGLGCNYGATDINEPDGWAPENYGDLFSGYEDCVGGVWTSNENGIWYTFTVDANTPQPITLDILNINCDNTGGGDLQMGIWEDNGACTLGEANFVECAVGTGNVTLGPVNLPPGDYYLYVDGNGGANCEWEFVSDELLCPPAVFEDITGNSPYLCDDTPVDLIALDNDAAGGFIQPGFDFDILTDGFSDTENSVEFYDGPNGTGNLVGTFAIGDIPENSNWTVVGQYFDTNTTYSLVWCDSWPDGTFAYTVSDHATGATLATGTFNHNNGQNCFIVDFGPLSGISTFSGPGVTTNGDGTGLFDPSAAGPGTHDIVYSWDSEAGCVSSTTQTVEVLAPTIDNVDTVDPNCNDNSGSITITASNGNNIEYSIDGGVNFQPDNVFNGLPSGTYDIVIQVGNCTESTQVTLTDNPPPVIDSIVPTNETCSGANGSVDITITSGTAPFTFDWSNDGIGDSDDTEDLSNLPAGTYTVTVTDVNGCTDTGGVIVTNSPEPNIDNTISSNPTCGNSNGNISVSASGGTPPLIYSIDGGTTTQPGSFFNNLPAGTYNILVTDDNGCTANDVVTLTDLLGATIDNVATVDPTCGNADGTVTITASGGTAPLSYSIDGGVTTQPGNIFSGLPAGTYNVAVVDATNCITNGTATLTDQDGPSVDNVDTVDPTCGDTNGSITIMASGGTAPLSYSIDGGITIQAIGVFSNLPAGTYSIQIEDANGCIASASATLTDQASPIIDNVTTVDPNCGASDGSLTIIASGGTAPLEYSIDNGVTFQSSATFTGLTAGNYDVVVQDANACDVSGFVVLVDLTGPTIDNVTTVDPNCGGNDGSLTIVASGGTAPLEYSIDNGGTFQSSATFTGLAAGNYDIIVQDANACAANTVATLVDLPGPTIDNVTTVDPNCGASDGALTIIASGGTTPLEYSIDNGVTFQTSATFTGLAAGAYNIVVQDANSCSEATVANLTDLSGPSIDDVLTTDTVCEGTDGILTIVASGGISPLQYSIDNGITFQASPTFSSLAPGTYDIIVQDANNCNTAGQATINTTLIPVIDNIDTTDELCGGDNGIITLTVSSGTPPYEYSINNGVSFQASNVFTDLSANTYTIIVQDANGCSVTSSVIVNEQAAPNIGSVSVDNPDCGANNGTLTVTVIGGMPPYTYSIDNGVTFQGTATFTGLAPGIYDVVIEDANGCTDSMPGLLTEGSGPEIDNIGVTEPTCGNANGAITITASSGTTPYEYSIDNGVTFQSSATFTGLAGGNYDVIVQDLNGCTDASVATLTDLGSPSIDDVLITDSVCEGADGVLTIVASEGTLPLEYSIDNGVTFQSLPTFTDLTAGTYDIVVQDADACTASTQAIIDTSPVPVIDDIDTTDELCGDSNGEITITVSSGTAPFEYSINNGVSFQSGNIFTGLAGGTYDIVVQDVNGCSVTSSVILGAEPAPTIGGVSVGNPACGATDGSITITGLGGNPPFEYSIDNGMTFQASATFTGLGQGTYDVVVQDSNGCTDNTTAVLTDEPGPGIDNVAITEPTCGNPNGSIIITASSGTAPLSYSIDNGTTTQVGGTFNGLAAGTYDIVVSDINGCTDTGTATLTDQAGATIDNVATSDPTCGDSNGTITITASGGTAPLEYSIDNGATFQANGSFAGLAPGVYDIVVQDVNACSTNSTATLTDQPGATIDNVTTVDPTCDDSNGTITITVSGGTAPLEYSIDNGTTFQSGNTFMGLTDGTYDIVVQDANNCITMDQATLNMSTFPVIDNVNVVDTSCDEDNGSITINISGGTAPFDYSINGGTTSQSTGVFDNLSPGNYDILVTDANGCTATSQATIAPSSSPSIVGVDEFDTTCGEDNGAIEVAVTDGTAPYSYSLNGGTAQTSNVFVFQAPGTYDIVVTDAAGCTVSAQATLAPSEGPQIDNLQTDNGSCGDPNALINVMASGGATPYEYSIDGGTTFQSAAVFPNLTDGTYDVIVQDANGCTDETTVTLTNTGDPNIDFAILDDPSSCNAFDGSIEIIASGGAAPLEYSNNNGMAYQSSPVFTGLGANTYNLVVMDAVGCTDTVIVILNDPIEAAIDTVFYNNPTCGEDNGSIEIIVDDSNPNYEYSIDGGVTFQGSNTFEDLSDGTYNIVMVDFLGCTAFWQPITLVNPGAPMVDNVDITSPICGDDNGVITITASGGTTPYEYSIDNVNYQTAATFVGLGAGQYTVWVRDAAGCEVEEVVIITTAGEITMTIVTDNPTDCDTNDGTITITANNGTPPYEYSINNGMSYQSSGIFTGLGVNTYNVVVQDANGCLAVDVVDLTGTDDPEIIDVIVVDAECGQDNGSIEITVTGGTPNYEYSIDGGNVFQGSNTFEDLPAGMYDILVVDFKGCEASTQAIINNPGAPEITNIEALNPSCGDVNGSIIITATGGTTPLEYSIDGGATFQTNTAFTGLGAGIYDIVLVDAAGCELFDQAILENAGDVVIDQTFITDPLCNDNNGGVVIVASGGTMPYEYSIDNGMTSQNNGTFSNVGPGTINVVVTDVNGCQATDQLVLTSDAPVIDSIGIEQPTCEEANGMISVFVQNGTANYQYSIDGGASYSADNIFDGLVTGTYDIIVEDLNGCQATQTVELFPTQGANPQIIPNGEAEACFNEPLTLDAGIFDSYEWSTGETTQTIMVDQFGVYFVTVTNSFGCTGVDYVQVNVTTPFTVEATEDQTIELGDDYSMSVVFENPNLTYTWTGSDGSTGDGPTFSTVAEEQGTITYTLTGTDVNGCTVTDEVVITIVDTSNYTMPNAFSPNGDGLNEDFGPVITGTIEVVEFKVFNRWGELVHNDPTSRWDGFYKGERQETDVYVYLITLETYEGEQIELTGDIHLMR